MFSLNKKLNKLLCFTVLSIQLVSGSLHLIYAYISHGNFVPYNILTSVSLQRFIPKQRITCCLH